MAGKTISAYTDSETALRVGAIAKVEHRTQAHIGGMALKLFFYQKRQGRHYGKLKQWEMHSYGNP